MKWLASIAIALVIAIIPGQSFADDGNGTPDLLLRVGADVRIAPGETVGSLIVIDGDAQIDGEIEDNVLVVNGDAVVTGKIGGNLTVISGNIDLQGTAQVHNIASVRGDLTQSGNARVTGEINERDSFAFLGLAATVFSILFWLAMTFTVVVAGLVFAAIGGRQLTQAATAMTNSVVNVILGVVFVWVAIPVLAVLAMVTLIGIPLGIGLFIFLLPALWFLGYIVAGARLGGAIVGRAGRESGGHAFAATTLGLMVLQLVALVPGLGALVVLLAGLWGAGALAYSAYRAAGGKGFEESSVQGVQTQQPAG